MPYDITIEPREDAPRGWTDPLSDDLSEYRVRPCRSGVAIEGLALHELWGVLSYVAEYEVPVGCMTVEHREDAS